MSRTIRFGVLARVVADGPEWARLAREAETLGFSSLAVTDHVGDQLAPLPALAAAAMATSHITLTAAVLANDFRHPSIVAKELATVDVLSEGRLEVGLGAGWLEAEYRRAGIPFDPAGRRIDRLAEAVTVIRRLLAGEEVWHAGTHYVLEGMRNSPPTIQQPVPLVLGGGGRRMLELAARQADIVSITTDNRTRRELGFQPGGNWPAVRRQVGWIREAAGARYGEIELNTVVPCAAVTDDRIATATRLAATMGVDPLDLLDSPFVLIGTVDEIVEQVRRTRDELDISYFTVAHRFAFDLAPVVEAVTGS